MDNVLPHSLFADSEQLLQLILKALDDVVEYDLAVILKLREDNTLAVEHVRGRLSTPQLASLRISLDERQDIATLLNRRSPTVFSEHKDHKDTYHTVIDLPVDHSCMVAPLCLEDRVLGMLTLDHQVCNMYPPEIVRFIDTLAKLISIIIAQSDTSRHLLSLQHQLTEERNMLLSPNADVFHDVIGSSPAWQATLEAARTVAGSDLSVLIQGETGTGKEQVSRLIHRLSTRCDNPFVALNCSTLNPTLAESELFGHEKGAFTSAHSQHKGRFELADGGTLFLDEIGDLPLELQPKLLRALQERRFERVGGEKTVSCDVRVIAASHVDLARAIDEKRFREDLYYRLNVFPITLPPLRERDQDIILLAEYFLSELRSREHYGGIYLSATAVEELLTYSWPGNVRELQNVIRRAALVAGGNSIEPQHLALAGGRSRPAVNGRSGYAGPNGVSIRTEGGLATLDMVMREHIQRTLAACGGKIYGADGAAQSLGLKPTTLQSRMKKLGITRQGL